MKPCADIRLSNEQWDKIDGCLNEIGIDLADVDIQIDESLAIVRAFKSIIRIRLDTKE